MEIKKVIGGVALGAVALELLKLATKSSSSGQPKNTFQDRPLPRKEKKTYYCKFCGEEFHSLRQLTINKCGRHPLGHWKGYHEPYEGR